MSIVAEVWQGPRHLPLGLAWNPEPGRRDLHAGAESRALFELSPVPLLIVSADSGLIRNCNRSAADLFGGRTSDFIDSYLPAMLHEAEARQAVAGSLHLGTALQRILVRIRTTQARTLWVLLSTQHAAQGGEPVVIVSLADITAYKEREDELREQSVRDSLTGVLNRRGLFDALDRELAIGRRAQRMPVVALLDLDHFKSINDRFGHAGGDEVLRKSAETITGQLRRSDWAGRYGGEEFVVVLPHTTGAAALEVVERIRKAVHALRIPWSDQVISLSLSGGISQARHDEDAASILRRADEALYGAKSAGRNRIMSRD